MVRQSAVEDMKRAGYELFTVEEAAILAKQSEITIRRAISEGRLVTRKVGGSRRITRKSLEEYLGGPPD